jgi:polo-like kinase 1
MLLKAGHSYAVDVWAIGCILFTLLVGKPPFETESLKQTYSKIRNNEYAIPKRIGQQAHVLISALLAPAPENRPTVFDIPKFDFFTRGFMPTGLPQSCLTSAPRFNSDNVCGGMVKVTIFWYILFFA